MSRQIRLSHNKIKSFAKLCVFDTLFPEKLSFPYQVLQIIYHYFKSRAIISTSLSYLGSDIKLCNNLRRLQNPFYRIQRNPYQNSPSIWSFTTIYQISFTYPGFKDSVAI